MGFFSGLKSFIKPLTSFLPALTPFAPYASAAASAYGAYNQNRENRSISAHQRNFQYDLSSTAYQRSMADMRAAGLNPILAYKQGGASSPSGAGIPAVSESEGAINSALAQRRANAEIKGIEAQTSLTTAKKNVIAPAATVGSSVDNVINNLIDWIVKPTTPGGVSVQSIKNLTRQQQFKKAFGRNADKVKTLINNIASGKITKQDGIKALKLYQGKHPPTSKGFY